MRSSGILMHISSLPSNYGIGTMGKTAYDFVDFLKQSGQKIWQLLPINPTSYGDSPYSSFSLYAGNPYFIDLDILHEEKLLEHSEYHNLNWGDDEEKVDYGKIFELRFNVLKKAFERFIKNADFQYEAFKQDNYFWLYDYSLYMALKFDNNNLSWQEWDEALRKRDKEALHQKEIQLKNEIEFWKFVQYKFYKQFYKLKQYANKNGIKIIGDIPIYVALDSADVWANPELFMLDEDLKPIEVAGCPPDDFAKTGQLWGNPLYNWEVMKQRGYDWWVNRIGTATKIYDIVRIDHFRGFESYYAIKAESETAEHGTWRKGPDIELFNTIKAKLSNPDIIAEDLGHFTEPVKTLLNATGYPGMKVLQFGFNSGEDSTFLPHNFKRNTVCYTGTHDNDTIKGWLDSLNEADLKYVMDYLNVDNKDDCIYGLIRLAWASVCDMAITTMQDLLKLPTEARMNIPSTAQGNWRWRMKKDQLTQELTQKLYTLTKLYWR
ncbi:4-alpha-glucanotransferase [Paludicola sp. MB14-C6]|uniref:4-alpha-glucanotransferase n=1 Tax=Paludihabitans sp. MB14-C6 TaxID=3070656 RepID=UPI0027DC90A9|nr:4-alpha-glucanotransferase [Paludicola sp. MB14-C6]WMJ23228.1 4-alpha-glucanotransferase [Paludicola sp. MB14-C6]